MQSIKQLPSKQKGLTLIEASVWFVIFALVIAGALKMWNIVSSEQTSTAMTSDVVALRSAMQQLYSGQGSYGAANVNNTLAVANKIPTSIKVNTTTNPYTLTNQQDGTINIVGNGTTFSITTTNISADVCTALVSGLANQGFIGISVNGSALALPPTPDTASAACAAAPNAIALTSN